MDKHTPQPMIGSRLEPEAPPETLLKEAWQIFKKDRLAMASLVILVLLLLAAITGKTLTEWTPIFDPTAVRLVDKFLPPGSSPSKVVPDQDKPTYGVY
jgi:ABC-type antimicrobial peptide transport system permease subunit